MTVNSTNMIEKNQTSLFVDEITFVRKTSFLNGVTGCQFTSTALYRVFIGDMEDQPVFVVHFRVFILTKL
jgi:hypothetical protein